MIIKKGLLMMVLGLSSILIVGCVSNKSVMTAENLDWNLRYSSNEDVAMFRCEIPSLDSRVAVLMNPQQVRFRATLITPQLIANAIDILETAETIKSKELTTSNDSYLAFMFDFEPDQDIYKASELSPEYYPADRFALSEMIFDFEDMTVDPADFVTLEIDGEILHLDNLPHEMRAQELYIIPIDSNSALNERKAASLTAHVTMFPPFRLENCNSGNTKKFTLNLYTPQGNLNKLPELYGELNETIPDQFITDVRLKLLTELVFSEPQMPETTSIPDSETPTPTGNGA